MRKWDVRRGWVACWFLGAWFVLSLAVATPLARSDGKVMPPLLVPQEVTMPDQRALLAWSDGVETLVIESAFVGKGTDFAWVVPLPSKPEVEAATRGTLASVAALMQPVVKPPVPELWLLLIGLLLIGALALFAGWWLVGWLFRAGVVAGAGLLIGGLVTLWIKPDVWWILLPSAVLAACWLGRGVIRRETSLFNHLIALIVTLLVLAILTPTVGRLSSFGGPAPEAGGVTVERGVVGDFDVSLVSGREGDGVVGWLRENGYAINGEAAKVAAEHAAAGGWFVASRVRREFAESGRSVPAPLLFRFAAEEPVYPMRLTGAGAKEPLELELFILGPERAVAEGLRPVAWGPVSVGDPTEGAYRRGTGQPREARVVTHPSLARLAEGAKVITQLRGKLIPAEMQADIRPRWEAGAEASHGLVAWAREAAAQSALAAGGGLALILSIWLGFRHGGRRPPLCRSTAALVAGAATGGLLFASLPSVATRGMHDGKAIPWYDLRQVPAVAGWVVGELDPTTSDEAVRAAFAVEFRKFLKGSGWQMEIGDAPGQVELVKTTEGKWRAILYDAAGQARYQPDEEFELGWGRADSAKTKSPAR